MELLKNIEKRLIEELNPKVKLVLETSRYLIEGGGKRLRPLITVLSCGMCGGNPEEAIPLGVGLEYIHAASLLHDDVVDGASKRRGKTSANVIFGNGTAVLTGDYMYAKALHLFTRYGTKEMIEVVSEAVMEMAEAQVLEISKVGELISEEDYFRIIDGKTAVLFSACTTVGALCANYRYPEQIKKIGYHMGRAFQLIDDLLDYTGDPQKTGKPVANDLKEGKATYPLLCVINQMNKEKVKKILSDPNPPSEEIDNLRKEVLKLGGANKTREKARTEAERAYEILKRLDHTHYREEMERILEFIVFREL